MAIDEQAVLQLTIEVRQALADIEQVRARYDAAIKNMQAATKAGLDPASAEFVHLREEARKAGLEVVQVGERAKAAMKALAHETGQSATGIKDISVGIATVRAEANKVGTEGTRGFNLLSVGIEKTASRLKTFGLGLVAGILIQEFIPAVKDAASGLGDFIAQLQMGEQEAVRFGERTRSMADMRVFHAERVTRVEAEQAKAAASSALSIEEVADAISVHRRAIDAAEATYAKVNLSTASLAEISDALAAKRKALAAAEREYHEALSGTDELQQMEIERGKAVADEINAELDAEHKLKDALAGSRDELERRVETLVSVVTALEEHGDVNQKVAANIHEEAAKLLADYKSFGIQVPDALAKVAGAYPAWLAQTEKQTEAQKRLTAATEETTEAAQRGLFGKDPAEIAGLKEEEKTLRGTVDALKKKQDQAGLTTEELAQLFDAEDRLRKVSFELKRALADVVTPLSVTGQAAELTADQIAVLVTEMTAAGHVWDGSSEQLHAWLLAASETGKEAKILTGVHGGLTKELSNNQRAVQGLAEHQHEFNREAIASAEAMGKLATQATSAAQGIEAAKLQIAGTDLATVQQTAEQAERLVRAIRAARAEWKGMASEDLPEVLELLGKIRLIQDSDDTGENVM